MQVAPAPDAILKFCSTEHAAVRIHLYVKIDNVFVMLDANCGVLRIFSGKMHLKLPKPDGFCQLMFKFDCCCIWQTIQLVLPKSRTWHGIERKFRYEISKMPEWNGMKDFKNGMEDNLPYF